MRSRMFRLAAVTAVAAIAFMLVTIPAVDAQEEPPPPWSGSKITSPASTVATSAVSVAGVFENATSYPTEVFIEFGRMNGSSFADADDDDCVPDDPGTRETEPDISERRVAFSAGPFTFSCNGRFAVRVRTVPQVTSPTLLRTFDVVAPPAPVSSMSAEVSQVDEKTGATAEDPASVAVEWAPSNESYRDFLGYRIQRTGPGDTGTTNVSGTLAPGTTTYTDEVEAPGRYTYSVQSLRSGPNGDVPSGAGTPTDEIRVAGPKATTSTSAPNDDDNNDGDGSGSGVTQPRDTSRLTIPEARAGGGSPRSRSGITVPRTPGTIDTGFDEELDYGERPGDSEPGDENALAGEGQSIIRSDEAGPGLLGPVAGALVLLGWAGHVAYLNRLARQF